MNASVLSSTSLSIKLTRRFSKEFWTKSQKKSSGKYNLKIQTSKKTCFLLTTCSQITREMILWMKLEKSKQMHPSFTKLAQILIRSARGLTWNSISTTKSSHLRRWISCSSMTLLVTWCGLLVSLTLQEGTHSSSEWVVQANNHWLNLLRQLPSKSFSRSPWPSHIT
jgi:hypothetical protein